jgi:2-dehydropantoate 2-reductase
MRILVIGAGAVGGYFGGRLAQAGRDVTFLVHAGRAAAFAKEGLRVLSPHGDFTLQPKTLVASSIAHTYDLLLLSVKAYGLEAAINDFAAAVDQNTMILPVLNGMRHIDVLRQRFGTRTVIGGACVVSAEVDAEGRVKQLSPIQTLSYGEPEGGGSARMTVLDTVMQNAGFDARLSTNILQAMWDKWVQLASLGALTCLFRGSIGDIAAVPGSQAIAIEIINECAAIASRCGHPPENSMLAAARGALTAPGSELTSSMYRDMAQNRPVELEAILGDLVARGRGVGHRTPWLEAALITLSIYQTRLGRPNATPPKAPTSG